MYGRPMMCLAATASALLALSVPAPAEQRDAATTEQWSNFKKAFGACLDGKKYTVTF